VVSAHQVPDLAFHLGSGGAVARDPVRVALPGPGLGELLLVDPDPVAAPHGGLGALLAQRTAGAGGTEAAGPVGAAPDRRGLTGRTGHRVGFEVDVETVLGEQPAGRDRVLGLAHRLDPSLPQQVVERPRPVGVVAEHRRGALAVCALAGDLDISLICLSLGRGPGGALLNAAAWNDHANGILSRCHRDTQPVTVLFCDLDEFKTVNDTHGHLVGDQVLVAVTDCLRRELRGHDGLGRYGGEEFVIILDRLDMDAAQQVADRLRAAMSSLHVVDGLQVTMSIGLAHHQPEHGWSDLNQLMARTDAALYHAKSSGRDRVQTE